MIGIVSDLAQAFWNGRDGMLLLRDTAAARDLIVSLYERLDPSVCPLKYA